MSRHLASHFPSIRRMKEREIYEVAHTTGSRSTLLVLSSRTLPEDLSRSRLVWRVRFPFYYRPSLLPPPFLILRLTDALPSATNSPLRTVEAAEETLVVATEEAINLMRAVLENPEPLKNLAALIKAQQQFYAEAQEALSSVSAEVEEAAVEAEAE